MRKILLAIAIIFSALVIAGCESKGGLERELYEITHGVYQMPDGRKLEYGEFRGQTPPEGKVYRPHRTENTRLFRVTIETDYMDIETFIKCPCCGNEFAEKDVVYMSH